tara:strand:- start:3577 stop:3747 length:171 start_codon:yes stop_codon:yes gene_type:complete
MFFANLCAVFKKIENERVLGLLLILLLGFIILWGIWSFYNTQLIDIENNIKQLNKK